MRFVKNGFITQSFMYFLGLSLLEYATLHAYLLLSTEVYGTLLLNISHYFSLVWGMVMPALAAMLSIISYSVGGFGYAVKTGAILSASRLFYYIFYFYMSFISQGFDSIESILLSLASSLGALAVVVAEVALYFLIGYLVLRRGANREKRSVPEYTFDALSVSDIFDVGVASTRVIALISASAFVTRLASLIFDTVSFFLKYGSGYSGDELISIILDYLILIILLVLTHITLSLVNRMVMRGRVYKED